MTIKTIEGIKIAAVSVALPTQKIEVTSYTDIFGEEVVQKFIETTGVESVCRSLPEQTASDLGFEAAKNLFEKKEA